MFVLYVTTHTKQYLNKKNNCYNICTVFSTHTKQYLNKKNNCFNIFTVFSTHTKQYLLKKNIESFTICEQSIP